MEDDESTHVLSEQEYSRQKRWKLLLIIGVCLNALVVFTSDLGLDTHIHLTYATVEAGQGEAALDWGHTRPIDPLSSDPSYAPVKEDGWFDFIGDSPTDVRLLSFAITLGFIGLLYKQQQLELAVMVALYPTFIFSTGRGYPEVFIAVMLYAVVILIAHACRQEDVNKARLRALSIAVPMAAIVAVKGMSMWWGLPFGLAALAWFEATRRSPTFATWASHPAKVAVVAGLGVGALMLVMGFFDPGNTLSVVGDAPVRFSSALLIAVFDVLVIYALFGMVLWPFFGPAIKGLSTTSDLEVACIAGLIAAFAAAITVYVAALWTYESLLWGADWPLMTWTMGNNGRYISLLLIPSFMMLKRMNDLGIEVPCLEDPGDKYRSLMIGLALILPLSILAAVNGQTMWSDEAGEVMALNMEEGEDFLFISETTLGMHWLYTFHYDIDPFGNNNNTGHWRADSTDWHDELVNGTKVENRGSLDDVEWLVIAPGAGEAPEGWGLAAHGEADFLNGGGTWKVYTTHEEIIVY
jgi:hypothetical protein